MFFMVTRKQPEVADNAWEQIGIIVAESAKVALEKSGLTEIEREERADYICIWATDPRGAEYSLESFQEITTAVGTE